MQSAFGIQARNLQGKPFDFRVYLPDLCPVCRQRIAPIQLNAGFTISDENALLDVVLRCPSANCERIFIARYRATTNNFDTLGNYPERWFHSESVPATFAPVVLDPVISDLSKRFVSIYSQAQEAEHQGMDEICGIGYRKALEILMKDYLKSVNKQYCAEIERKSLGTCVNEYVDSPKLKNVATRATWLGNDETHYLRKWPNKDLDDLKLLIQLTIHWILTEILTAQIESEMPAPRGGK